MMGAPGQGQLPGLGAHKLCQKSSSDDYGAMARARTRRRWAHVIAFFLSYDLHVTRALCSSIKDLEGGSTRANGAIRE